MIDLKHEVQRRMDCRHIIDRLIKMTEANKDIIDFVIDLSKNMGMILNMRQPMKSCLVNTAVYIAKDTNGKWDATTGAQFSHPYVFKTC